MKKLLIVRPDGIGDFVIFSAVLEEYTRIYPGYQIDIVCHPTVRALVEAIPFIHRVIPLDILRLFQKGRQARHTWKFYLQSFFWHYDVLIYPVCSRVRNADLVAHMIRAKVKIAYDGDSANDPSNERLLRNDYFSQIISSEKTKMKEVERNAEFINKLGGKLSVADLRTQIWFKKSDGLDCERVLKSHRLAIRNYICIFTGANLSIKCWSAERWVELIKKIFLHQPVMKVVFLGGAKERTINSKIINVLPNNDRIVDLTAKLNLRILAKIIKNSKIFIGTDSAAIHIAAAVGTPNVCIMGGGHFQRFYPYGDLTRNRIVCHPKDCYQCNWHCIYDVAKCIKDISVDEVFRAAEELLK